MTGIVNKTKPVCVRLSLLWNAPKQAVAGDSFSVSGASDSMALGSFFALQDRHAPKRKKPSWKAPKDTAAAPKAGGRSR
jgi:hypothetical protein